MSIGPIEMRPPPARHVDTPTSPPAQGEGESSFARLLHSVGREMNRGEATMHAALRAGGNMGVADLLALQAGVYRYSEAVDLAAKLVDRASSGIKTVIQGQ